MDPFSLVHVLVSLAQARKVSDELMSVARTAGVTDVRRAWLAPVVEGIWRGYPTRWKLQKSKKTSIVTVDIQAIAPARLRITPRAGAKQIYYLFGPPRLRISGHDEYFVRGDEMMLADRVLNDAVIGPLLADEVVNVTKAAVRVQAETWTLEGHAAILRCFKLACAIVERLGLPPTGRT